MDVSLPMVVKGPSCLRGLMHSVECRLNLAMLALLVYCMQATA